MIIMIDIKLQENIRKFRKEKGYSIQEFADLLYVSQPTVSGWESYGYVPRLDTLITMAELFGMSLDELVGLRPKISVKNDTIESIVRHLQTYSEEELLYFQDELLNNKVSIRLIEEKLIHATLEKIEATQHNDIEMANAWTNTIYFLENELSKEKEKRIK